MDERILRAKLILKGFKVDEFIEKVNENGNDTLRGINQDK